MAFLALTPALAMSGRRVAARARRTGDMMGFATTFRVADRSDTLLDIARRFGLGYVEIVAANSQIDPWLPAVGTEVLLPTAHIVPKGRRQGLIINLGDMRIYYFPPQGEALTFPIGVGQEGWSTPLGRTKVAGKRQDPTWIPPPSIRAENSDLPPSVPPGPDNPLGKFAIDLAFERISVHGTNKPDGVGRRVSHGCIRLYPEHIEQLFALVAIGMDVEVVNQPVKLGWHNGELYLEAHPTPRQADAIEQTGSHDTDIDTSVLFNAAAEAGMEDVDRLDIERIGIVLRERTGLPTRVTEPALDTQ